MSESNEKKYFKYIDNLLLRFPDKFNKEYFKYLDNPIYRPYLIRNKKPLITETQKVISPSISNENKDKKEIPITSDLILSMFPPSEEPIYKNNDDFSQYDKADKKTALLMSVAEKEYPKLWAKDHGLFFRLQFEKLIPLNRDKIFDWGDKEVKIISSIINEATLMNKKFYSLDASAFLEKLIEQEKGTKKKSFISKIFNREEEITVEEAELKIEQIKNELLELNSRAEKIKRIIDSKKYRVIVLATVLSVICSHVAIEDDFLYSSIQDKNVFLLNIHAQLLNVEKLNQDVDEQVFALKIKMKEVVDFILPSIKLSKSYAST